MAYKKYVMIQTIAGETFQIDEGEIDRDPDPAGRVNYIGSGAIKVFLSEGWELIEVLTHYSPKLDCTGVFYVIGKLEK